MKTMDSRWGKSELFEVIMATADAESGHLLPPMGRHIGAALRHAHAELLGGRGHAAVAEAQAALDLTHTSAAYLLLAVTLMQTNQPLPACITLFDLEQQNAELAELHLVKGWLLLTLNHPAEARAAFQQAVQRKPGLLLGWKLLIQMALESEGSNAAFLVFIEALQHNTPNLNLLALQNCLRKPPASVDTAALVQRMASQPAVEGLMAHDFAELASVCA